MKKEELSENGEKNQPKSVDPKDVTTENLLAKITELTQEIQIIKASNSNGGQGLSSDDIAKIALVVAQANKTINPKEIDYNNGIQQEQIPADDYDPIGVRFCCPYVGYSLTCDKRMGHIINLPFGRKEVFFNHAATRKIQTGKYTQLAPFSVFTSNSKKLTEWIREHSLYNIYFYESSTEALNSDVARALRLGNIVKMLQPLELHDLYRRATEYGVPTGEDPHTMRASIAAKMIEREILMEDQSVKGRLEETAKSAKLINRQ